MIRHLIAPAIDVAEHDRAADVATAAGLITLVYATPARLRPALGLAVAVGLSRVHGAGVERMRRDLLALLTDGRAQVSPRVDELEARLGREARLVDELEARLCDVEVCVLAPQTPEGTAERDEARRRIIVRANAR